MQKLKTFFAVISFLFVCINTHGQSVGVGTTSPNSSIAILHIEVPNSTTQPQGIILPQLSTAEIAILRDSAISAGADANGLLVYDSTTNQIKYYDSSLDIWRSLEVTTSTGMPVWSELTVDKGYTPDTIIIGNSSAVVPEVIFHVDGGAKVDSIIIANGASNGFVLTSDASGNASWQLLLPQTATNGDVLKWNGTSWAAGSDSTAVPAGTATGQIVVWNNTTGVWELGTSTGNGIYDGSGTTQAGETTVTITDTLSFNTGLVNGFNINDTVFSVDPTSGNIGIGTSNPANKLDVLGSLAVNDPDGRGSRVSLSSPGGDIGTSVFLGDNAGGYLRRYDTKISAVSENFMISQAIPTASDLLIIDTLGRVGIGVALPTEQLHVSGNIQADSIFIFDSFNAPTPGDVLTAIDATGRAYWSTLATPVQIFDTTVSGLIAPVVGSQNDNFVVGSSQLDDQAGVADNSRMFFNKTKSAFRVGEAVGNQWNDASIGTYSFGIGANTIASGAYSVAMGNNSDATGNASFATGTNTVASGVLSTVFGFENEAESFSEVVFGRFDTDYTPNSPIAWDDDDRLFVIGNGTSDAVRNDALVLLKNGYLGIGTSNPIERLHLDIGTDTVGLKIDGNGDITGIGVFNTKASGIAALLLDAQGDSAFMQLDGGTHELDIRYDESGSKINIKSELVEIEGDVTIDTLTNHAQFTYLPAGVSTTTSGHILTTDNAGNANWQAVPDDGHWVINGTNRTTPFSVGIGTNTTTTNTPPHQLLIAQTVNTTDGSDGSYVDVQNWFGGNGSNSTTIAGMRFKNGALTGDSYYKAAIMFQRNATSGRGDLIFANNNANDATNVTVTDSKMVIKNSGDVGIGTNNPTSKLFVDLGNNNGAIRVMRDGAAAGLYAGIELGNYNTLNTNAPKTAIYHQDNHSFSLGDMIFALNNTADYTTAVTPTDVKMIIKNSGDVGIGVISPVEKLEVAGSIKMIDGNQGNGNIMVSDADGVASWKTNQVSFNAGMAGASYIVTPFTTSTLLFDDTGAASHDPLNIYSNTTGEVTVPVAGVYHFDVMMSFQGAADGRIQFEIMVNGSTVVAQASNFVDAITTANMHENMSVTVQLDANDTISIQISDVEGSLTFRRDWSTFSGHLVYAN